MEKPVADYDDSFEVIKFPEGTESINQGIFEGCASIKAVYLPPSVKYIGSNAFRGCKSLVKINLENVERIANNAFEGCGSLDMICLSGRITKVGGEAFKNCGSLRVITTTDENRIDRGLTDHYAESPSALERIFRVNRHYKRCPIGNSAFSGCVSLEDAILPGGINVVESYAFQWCSSLESIIMNGVSRIYNNAFWRCKSLKTVILPAEAEVYKTSLDNSGKMVFTRIPDRSGMDFAKTPLHFWD